MKAKVKILMVWNKSFKLCQQYYALYSKVMKISLNENVYNLREIDSTTIKILNKSDIGKAV